MAKKYVPSGYQIINIDVSDKTSGTAFTPETEDEKLLESLLLNYKKPILLHLFTDDYGVISGYPIYSGGQLVFVLNGLIQEIIANGDGTLTWQQIEP